MTPPGPIRDRTEIWPTDWPRDLRRLSGDAKQEAAHIIATKLRRAVEGNGDDPGKPVAWERLARRRGIELCPYADIREAPGRYVPPRTPDGPAVIGVNIALPPEVQARAWVHEMAHDELHRWIPPQLANAADAYCYSGDVDEERHDIARLVEALVLG